jgi:hypothetical protein
MSSIYRITGFVAESGRRYVHIVADNGSAVLPYEAFSIANKRLATDLVSAGLAVFADEDLEAIVEEVRALSFFQPGGVVEHSGWNGTHFALLDGEVIAGDGPGAKVLFQTEVGRVSSRGDLESWKQGFAMAVKDHPLPAFALMAMFLPPLLRFMSQVGNTTIELVGPGYSGKSIALTGAISAVGPNSYVIGLRNVQSDLAGVQSQSRDYPLVIDFVASALATATKPKKAEFFTAIDYDLARADGGRVTLLSGRQALRDACDMPTREDGIISIPIPPGSQGVFAVLPDGFASYAAFSDHLIATANANYGVAFPSFIQALRADLKTDKNAVKARIDRLQNRFLAMPEVRTNNGVEHRVARAFAAVYTAACLAIRYGVLPARFPRKSATLAVLDMYHQAETARLPFLSRLENLIASGELVTITNEADSAAQALVIGNALGSLTIKANERIAKIPPEKIEHAFSDWKRIRGTDEVRALLKRDGKNLTTWGHLAPGLERIRLHQFVLPPVAAEQSMFVGIREAT